MLAWYGIAIPGTRYGVGVIVKRRITSHPPSTLSSAEIAPEAE
jgi:hypothetical protein